MRRRTLAVSVCLVLAAVLFTALMLLPASDASASVCMKKPAADMVLINGNVITVDNRFSIKEAVAVRDNKIIAVGSTKQIQQWIGRSTEVIDLKGATLLPGINDSHAHVASYGLSMQELDVSYPGCQSVEDVAALVAAKVATVEDGTWIRGSGWNEAYFPGYVEPTKEDLDPVSLDNPVILTHFSGHSIWVNSAALEAAGIDKDTVPPQGGEIVKDPITGEPTGVLRENATDLVYEHVPPYTREEQKQGILEGIHEMTINGITSLTEPGIYSGGDTMSLYKELYAEGALKARMAVLVGMGDDFAEFKANLDAYTPPVGFDRTWLQFPGVKIFADGIPPTRTAWMWTTYWADRNTPLDPEFFGSLVIDAPTPEEKYKQLVDMICYAYGKGYQVVVHATGSRACTSVVDGLAKARKMYPWIRDPRPVIIHAELLLPDDCKRLAKLGGGTNMQPFIVKINADSAADIVGPVVAPYGFPSRTMIDAGVKVMYSSDANVTYPNWRSGVQQAILREGFSGYVNGPDQIVTRAEAIRAYTINGAWQDHMEKLKGSIEVGKLADFCVLRDNILTVDAHAIEFIPVLMTILDGKIIYDAR
jgi:predicted amidohydrolase YtcJ